jgi:uncharacterized OsmC-like protein
MNEAVAIPTSEEAPVDVIVRGKASGFLQEVEVGRFRMQADEPASIGGTDQAPTPYDHLLAALGTCTSMTVGLYARKKQWPLEEVTIALHHSRIHARDCDDCETKVGMLDRIRLNLSFTGDLTDEQRAKLIEIAHKCPVHRTLTSEIKIDLHARK